MALLQSTMSATLLGIAPIAHWRRSCRRASGGSRRTRTNTRKSS
jgi:hypothetical protein